MLATYLTQTWKLDVPVIGAPMSPMAGGKLAGAISRAGGLGMIGVGAATPVADLERDVAELRAITDRPFGIGLMTWVLARRPELLDAAIRARPFAIALSFGDPAPYVARVRDAGIHAVSQVQDRASAIAAERAGMQLVVAQGTDAGGHTGHVGTLPLLQIVLDAVSVPVVAAGGIATGRGLAAVIAAGAAGGWIGTPFLVADEARNSDAARRRVLDARETDTILTRAFDAAQRIPWPAQFPGRALANDFARAWTGREASLGDGERAAYAAAKAGEDYATAVIYAGQAVGLVARVEPAEAIVRRIAGDAEARLREVYRSVGAAPAQVEPLAPR